MSLKFFIFHGWGADSSANWFEHTRQFIVEAGAECHVPDFPESESPVYGEWVRHLEEHVEKIDENSVILGHSLGCGFINRYLSENDIKIKALILVAPTLNDCGIREIRNFFLTTLDYQKIQNSVELIHILASTDDPFIPLEDIKILGEKLSVDPVILANREHLWQPQILELDVLLTKIIES